MDLYVKKLGEFNPKPVNSPYESGCPRPFFVTKEKLDEINGTPYDYDMICWEGDIICQIWNNKYGWFDNKKSLIDIGAGAGEYPIYAGFAHSYAFEPNKESACLIYTNMISTDHIYDIDVLPYAISDNPGFRDFNGWSEDVGLHYDNFNKPESVVEFRTLDSFNLNNIGLIKVDIEGFEYHAIKSGLGTIIRNNYPPLLIEVWTDYQINLFFDEKQRPIYIERQQKLLDLLNKLGYEMILDPSLGDWETKFFIHKDQLNGYENPKES